MLRWIGVACILSGGLLTSRAMLGEARRAQRTRRELAEAFEAMAAEIRALLTPLPALLRRSRGRCVEAFFADASRRLSRGETLTEAWRDAAALLTLPREEREAVAALGGRLSGDGESVCAALALSASALRRSHERAELSRRETERLTTSICISISLFFAILLL